MLMSDRSAAGSLVLNHRLAAAKGFYSNCHTEKQMTTAEGIVFISHFLLCSLQCATTKSLPISKLATR